MDCCIKMSAICKSGITVSFASRQVCLARFRKPASLSCSLLQVCKLHGSRSCEIASCIALAVEQVCDLHRDRTCDTWRCFASVIAVAFASSWNHRDRFRNSREVLRVCSSEHTASSRSWLQTREIHHDRIRRFAEATAQWLNMVIKGCTGHGWGNIKVGNEWARWNKATLSPQINWRV